MSVYPLEFRNVSGGYGSMRIVHDVSARIEHGECLCVLGRNGVGKSTLMKMLSGHLRHTAGRISISGVGVDNLGPDQRKSLGLSYAMQERPVFDNLSTRDNLMLMLPPGSLGLYQPFFDAFPVLEKRLTQRAGTLSGGERKILSFARTLAEEGAVTLLDEPSEGVQSENIDVMKRFILDAKSTGRSFLVVEQHLRLAAEIADTLMVIDQGRAVLQDDASKMGRTEILRHINI